MFRNNTKYKLRGGKNFFPEEYISKKGFFFAFLAIIVILILSGSIILTDSNSKTVFAHSALARGGEDSSDDLEENRGGRGSSGDNSSGSSNSRGDSSDDNNDDRREDRRQDSPITPSGVSSSSQDDNNGVRIRRSLGSDDNRREIRFSENENIKTRLKDDESRTSVISGGIKTTFINKDGRFIVKAEREDGTEVELQDDEIFKIDDRLSRNNIKVSTAGVERLLIQRNNTAAVTNFPVSVDLITNELVVNTSAGQKIVAVLPDKAIENLIATNVVNKLGVQKVIDDVQGGNAASVKEVIALGEKNGLPIYEINGISNQKLLGFIPVSISRVVNVSAETGKVVSVNMSFFANLIDLLSA